MMEIKKQFEYLIQAAKQSYELDKKNIKKLKEYVDILRKYLKSNIADKVDYYDYLNKYSELLENLLENYKSEEVYFIEKISTDLELKDYESSYKFCKLYLNTFPESEKAYILMLKIFYKLKDYESFKKFLNNIQNKFGKELSGVKLEEIINYWKGGQTV